MNAKLQGTITIDGLIEGRVPDFDDIEDRLRQWVQAARAKHLAFSLELEGRTFSVLAENRAIPSADLGPDPGDTIAEVLRDLLVIFPPTHRADLVSSVRSVEYGQNVEIQTLYAVARDGRLETRQRTVDARTTAPPEPLTTRQKLRLAAVGLGAAAVVFAVSWIWVPYGALFDRLWDRVVPFDTDAVIVETGEFAPYFAVDKKAVARSGGNKYLIVTVKRTKAFPRDAKAIDALFARPGRTGAEAMTAQALARGYVRCEMFDKDGKFAGFSDARIAGLRTAETVELTLPMPRESRLARVAIRY